MALQFPKNRYLSLVRVGEKGQIVIPKGARDLFHIQPGDQLLLLADKKQGIALVTEESITTPQRLWSLAKEEEADESAGD